MTNLLLDIDYLERASLSCDKLKDELIRPNGRSSALSVPTHVSCILVPDFSGTRNLASRDSDECLSLVAEFS